jgi:hypothetical protein
MPRTMAAPAVLASLRRRHAGIGTRRIHFATAAIPMPMPDEQTIHPARFIDSATGATPRPSSAQGWHLTA